MKNNQQPITFVQISARAWLGLMVLLAMTGAIAAQRPQTPGTVASYTETHCSGFMAASEVTPVARVVGAEEGKKKNDLAVGDLVYLDRGLKGGAQLKEEFFVVRPVSVLPNMGTLYADVAHVQVVDVHEDISVGRIEFSCEPLGVGNWLIVPQPRAMPPSPGPAVLDRFAKPTGKGVGQIIASKNKVVQLGQGLIVYVNVGADQGVKEGDTLRIYRPYKEASVNQFNKRVYKEVAKKYNFPRQVLGECVVLHVGKGVSTAIITQSIEELAVGDWVELE